VIRRRLDAVSSEYVPRRAISGASLGEPMTSMTLSLAFDSPLTKYQPVGMFPSMTASETPHGSKTRFLDAAMRVIRAKGYTAARIEDVCEAAGLTKGSFFHHFDTKEDLALAAADHFAAMADRLFAAAPYRQIADPLERLLAYVDFRGAILQGELPDYTCLLGTMVQEVYETHPAIRAACERHIGAHAETVARDIAEAKERYAPNASWNPDSLALFTQAVIQGAFVLAKAKHGPEIAAECLTHLRRYIETQFDRNPN
jgi:TetR/AcrR family transcriptional regulator, transcriptional repressor for nem operon